MPTHGCIPCETARCCICAGHQHGLYGASGLPPERSPISVLSFPVENILPVSGVGFDPGYLQQTVMGNPPTGDNIVVYTRWRDGTYRLFGMIQGVETELFVAPEIKPPVNEDGTPKERDPQESLWDYLIED